jgi:hypothetical protein
MRKNLGDEMSSSTFPSFEDIRKNKRNINWRIYRRSFLLPGSDFHQILKQGKFIVINKETIILVEFHPRFDKGAQINESVFIFLSDARKAIEDKDWNLAKRLVKQAQQAAPVHYPGINLTTFIRCL